MFLILTLCIQTMSVESAPRLSIRRPNALILRDSKNEFFMAFESKEERSDWMGTINQVSPKHQLKFIYKAFSVYTYYYCTNYYLHVHNMYLCIMGTFTRSCIVYA